jgi:hypothetical protein
LAEDQQALLPSLDSLQLLRAVTCLAQLGCLQGKSPKQEQLVERLLQHLQEQQLQPAVWLALPGLISSLQVVPGGQSQPGLAHLLKQLRAMHDERPAVLQQAPPADVLRLVAGLQTQPQPDQLVWQQQMPELAQQLLRGMRELCASATAAAAAVVAAVQLPDGANQQLTLQQQADVIQQQQQQQQALLQVLDVQEWVAVVEAVSRLPSSDAPPAAAAAAASVGAPPGSAEVALLLQVLLDSEFLHHRFEQQPAPPALSGQQQEQQGPQSVLVPYVFDAQDWDSLAKLLGLYVHWLPLEQLPQQLVALIHEIAETQAALGSLLACSIETAVGLLWGLGVAGGLQLELWDTLSAPLDRPGQPLSQVQMQRVFEAYCLAALKHVGPSPWTVSLPQLQAASEAYWQRVLVPAAAERERLLQGLVAAGLLAPGCCLTQPVQGHLLLFDVVVPGACGCR